MAGKTAILSIKIIADGKQAGREFQQTNSDLAKFEDGLNKASIGAGLAVAGIGALAIAAGNSASELQQATGAVESVFGTYAGEVKKFAEDAAVNVGLAESEYSSLASVIGSQLKNMGVPMEAVAGQTDDLVGLGADLAATFGGSTSDAVSALSSLLRGERDPIERYGVSIKAADVAAKLAAMGLSGLEGEAAKAAETQATLALLTEQTSAANGQFAREADTAAGAQQRANAQWENAQAQLGEVLLPIMADLANMLSEVAIWVSQNTELVTAIAAVVLVFAGAILAVNAAITIYRTVMAIATAAQIAWNIAVTANPIGLIILAIAALIAIIVFLVMNWETVAKVAGEVWDNIISWVQDAIEWLNLDDIFNNLVRGFQIVGEIAGDVWAGIIGWIEDVIGWVQDAIGWFASLFGAQNDSRASGRPGAGGWTPEDDSMVLAMLAGGDLPPAADDPFDDGTGAWPTWAAPFTSGDDGSSGGNTYIEVKFTGLVTDPDAVAREIERVLVDHSRKTGRPIQIGAPR